KKAAMTVGTDVVFSADSKIRRFLNSGNEKEKIEDLECKHKTSFVPCKKGVVYSAPFSCGSKYVGQTGKCVNVRLSQHKMNVSTPLGKQGHVPEHILECGCSEAFRKSQILYSSHRRTEREVVEAVWIRKEKDIISAPSLVIRPKEALEVEKFLSKSNR